MNRGDDILFQCLKGGADLVVRRTLAIVRFDLDPDDFAVPIDHVDGGMGNAEILGSLIGGIAQAVFVDDPMPRVGENWKVNFAFAICGNLLSKILAYIWWVNADCIQLNVLILFQKRS